MAYLARKKAEKGKRYQLYKGTKGKVKTKARLLKEALGKAVIKDEHVDYIDFIPAKYTLQIHGWPSEDSDIKNIGDVKRIIKIALQEGKDPLKEVDRHKAKTHYDLRIKKRTGTTWWGLTFFSCPWKATAEAKSMGSVKGYSVLAPGGKKLQKFLAEKAQKELTKEGIAERRDRIEWMKVKAQWFPPGSPGNPTKELPAFMIAIEFYKPCCIHRRELDFFDVSFFGDHLKGRYYNRLVERKMKAEELNVWQQEAIKKGKAKAFFNLSFYFWKAKTQWGDEKTPYTMEEVKSAAQGKKTLNKIPAPPKKK